jgi:hypothetical protein
MNKLHHRSDLDPDPDPWASVRIRIRQNDADPCRSAWSATLLHVQFVRDKPIQLMLNNIGAVDQGCKTFVRGLHVLPEVWISSFTPSTRWQVPARGATPSRQVCASKVTHGWGSKQFFWYPDPVFHTHYDSNLGPFGSGSESKCTLIWIWVKINSENYFQF